VTDWPEPFSDNHNPPRTPLPPFPSLLAATLTPPAGIPFADAIRDTLQR
jgi:hypothetical protein